MLKTAAARVPALLAAVEDLHPYECPEAIAVPVVAALGPYAAWVRGETA